MNFGFSVVPSAIRLDLPGPVNIDDTSAYNIGYHPALRIGSWVAAVNAYTGLSVGDYSGFNRSGNNGTMVGAQAGMYSTGAFCTFSGYNTGNSSQGNFNTFYGAQAGLNNSPDTITNTADVNTFVGHISGMNSSGSGNTFLGQQTGYNNYGSQSTYVGLEAGMNTGGSYNTSLGTASGEYGTGNYNISMGVGAGSFSVGSSNIYMGHGVGVTLTGDQNVLMGDNVSINGTTSSSSYNTFVGSQIFNYVNNSLPVTGVTMLGSSSHFTPQSGTAMSNATAVGYQASVQASNTMVFGNGNVNSWLFGSGAAAGSGKALVVGNSSSNGNGAYLSTGGVWTNASDRWKKENFQSLENEDILEKIEQLPVTRWNYKGLSEKHIGPMAQDFHRIFGLGTDDKSISTIDPSGIALAGIQELYKKYQASLTELAEQKEKVNQQGAELEEQKKLIQVLLTRMQSMEDALKATKEGKR